MQSKKSIPAAKKAANTAIMQAIKPPRPKDWPAIIRAWESSGIPQKQFCKTHGLSYTAFVYHRMQLNKQKNGASPLLPVQLIQPRQPAMAAPASNCCVVQWPNGVRLTVPSGVDAITLKMLLTTLEGL
jgi:hypothetical protein